MKLRIGSFCYIPPKGFGCSEAFWENIHRYPPRGELVIYSDYDWPGAVKLKASPEIFKGATFSDGPHRGKANPFSIHNGIFLFGLRMMRQRGITHALYLEQDCRVGVGGWDEIIFEEYFSLGRPCIVAGTLSVYNPTNSGLPSARKFQQLMQSPPKHGIPTAAYGWKGAAESCPFCLFPNGALAVYDVAWLTMLFNVASEQGIPTGLITQNTAFDMAVGAKLQEMFGEDAYEVIGSLSSVYSGFGDALTTPEQRRELLTSGRVVGIHQEKTNWQPL